jgi:uncharacterized protein YutE (UPF0331/DUF86 family)
MEPQKQIVIFLAEFDFQVKQIDSIYESLKKKAAKIEKKRVSLETVESAGYWIHNLYCAFEDLFKLVAGFWENSLKGNGEFHIHLLKMMMVEIEDVRPSLLSIASYKFLNELRGFRHVFRHAYSYGLDKERVSALLRKIFDQMDDVKSDLQAFRSTVAGYANDLNGSPTAD